METLTLVQCDDWQALYLDGRVACQGHSFDWPHELGRLGILDIKVHQAYGFMDEQGGGWFPAHLDEVWFDD